MQDDLLPAPVVTAADVMAALRGVRMAVTVESDTQADIAAALAAAGIEARREVILDSHNRIDLMAGHVGIEVKVKGAKRDILRQVQRYCTFPEIEALVLVTAVAMGLPREINGRPVHVHSVGRAWL